MKTRISIVLFAIAAILTGCKNDKSVDELDVVQPAAVETGFKVKIDFIAKVKDNFSLFYTEDGTSDFTKGEPIWKDVEGKEGTQTLEYDLPADVFPTQLRLDFGINKEQQDIVFQKFTIEYKGKTKVATGAEIGNYFRADDSKCSFDPKTGIIKAVVKDGVRQFPSLYPHEKILQPFLESVAK